MATVVAGKYELLEVLRDSGIRTWRARQITLGHSLMVHFIHGSQRGDDLALLDRLAQLPESARKQFFDAGEHDSVPYVVSWPLPEFDSLPSWLDRTIEKNRQQSKPVVPAPKTQPDTPSEFTRMFFKDMKEPAASGADDLFKGQLPAPPNLKTPPLPTTVTESPLPPKETGEFTRLFQVPVQVHKPSAEPPPRPPAKQPEPPPPLGSSPGEFTQFFRQAAPAEPHLPGPAQTELLPPPPLFPPADRPSARPVNTADLAPPPALPPKPAVAANPIQPPAADIPPVPKPPVAAVPPEPIVVDDYVKVIARPPAPPPLPVPPPSPVAPRKPPVALPQLPQMQKPPSSAYLPMWITLAVLFVVAVALTLLLALIK